MPIHKKIRSIFFAVAGASLVSLATPSSAQSPSQQESKTASTAITTITEQPQTSPVFDYAFGDQVAKSFQLPGAAGENWGPKELYKALRTFEDNHPGQLRGKNIFISIEDGSWLDVICYLPKITRLIEQKVYPANVVIMGVSETRTDLNGKKANRQLIKYIAEHNAIYGGPILCADAVKNKGIYPTSEDCFATARQSAMTALLRAKTIANTHRKPAVAPSP